MEGKFQTPFPEGDAMLNGKIEAEVFEDGGTEPTSIIGTDQSWYAHVTWEFNGLLVPLIGGWWNLQLHLESMGPGSEYSLPDPADVIPLTPGENNYSHHIEVTAGTVDTGAYKLVTTLTYTDLTDNPGPIAGYVEGPMLQFYEP